MKLKVLLDVLNQLPPLFFRISQQLFRTCGLDRLHSISLLFLLILKYLDLVIRTCNLLLLFGLFALDVLSVFERDFCVAGDLSDESGIDVLFMLLNHLD